ncbi:hypothetical protein ABFU65_21270 [Xanthomonas campestris pv. raphani]|uniref:hypothetical protein n=1 Tax=Xanthomonas campestris TaxID=339 RepID=UPI002B23538B|nr:hypothetical protein [Xanthomonas campestris]MEA9654089.1 hypothetical protein [Xanthomonas campestris pv. raphani]
MIVRSRGEARGERGGGDAREAKVDPTRPSHVSASGGRESQPDPVTPQQVPYRVIQLEWEAKKGYTNEPVENFDGLVTHHPNSNRFARLVNGSAVGGEPGRTMGLIGGEMQEIEVAKPGRSYGLRADQVLLKKDFILEDSRSPTGPASRALDVPSPVAGVVGAVDTTGGLVEVLDRKDGDVILRVRHMSPLHVKVGDQVEYGQALGMI